MSSETLAEIVARETVPDDAPAGEDAEALEASETDEQAGKGDETENGAEAPEQAAQPLTEAQADALFKSLEREDARHAREVEKRAAQMWADLAPCPCCTGAGSPAGYIFPVLPEPQQTLRRQAVTLALGGMGEPDYPDDPGAEVCDRCDGYGRLRTGSRVPEQATRPCPACTGMGWKQHVDVAAVFPPPPVQVGPQPWAGAPAPVAPPGYQLVPVPPNGAPAVPQPYGGS